MRCYHLGNMYLSPIQQGIQSAHAQMELFVRYQEDSIQRQLLFNWAQNHKTMICLNAGANAQLIDWQHFLAETDHTFPWATFHEEAGSVSHVSTLTNVAIVLPEHIYDCPITNDELATIFDYIDTDTTNSDHITIPPTPTTEERVYLYTPFEIHLIRWLRRCRLA